MNPRLFNLRIAFALLAFVPTVSRAGEPEAKETIAKAVQAIGGEDKQLKLFRIKERLNVSSDPEAKGAVRVSVLEPPTYWWVGKRERVREEKEPATFLVWAWTLGALTDPKSKVSSIKEIMEMEKPAVGLRVQGTINPAMDLYFDKLDHRLVRVDWRNDIHRFSEWKEHDCTRYPSKCVGYRKSNGKAWYFTEILELERLKELPKGLTR